MYITYLLLVATILISVKGFNDYSFRDRFMLNPYLITHEKAWYRSFTHAFLHGDFMHLAFNMFALYIFAVSVTPDMGNYESYSLEPELIRRYGNKGYLYFGMLYLGGILCSTLWTIAKYKNNPGYNALGASGAVSAVIFAYILLNPMTEMGVFPFPPIIPAFIFGPLLLISEYFLAKRGGTGIAHEAHIAGALFGIAFMAMVDFDLIVNFFDNFRL